VFIEIMDRKATVLQSVRGKLFSPQFSSARPSQIHFLFFRTNFKIKNKQHWDL